VVAAEDGWLVLSLCRSPAKLNVLAPLRRQYQTRETTSVCAGDDYNTTHTVATWQHGDITSGEYGIADRAFPVYTLGT
jgi:hypothetical protein